MRANKHLLLWSSLTTLVVFSVAALEENLCSDWRVAQRQVVLRLPADQAQAFSVELRQIVSPETASTDRCVSCHLGMAPGETGLPGDRTYGKHPDVVHDPGQIGCTVCHGGQGLATQKADAHGDVPHWPSPMIPRRYAYAGCGSCHAYLEVPNLAQLERGDDVFARNDCLACHRVDGRGGTSRPGNAGGLDGPDLSRSGATGFRIDWYAHHLARRAQARSGPWQTAIGEIPEGDRRAIDVYLRSRVGAPGLIEAKALFHTLGCRGCHKIAGVGGDDGPDLTLVGQKDPALTPFGFISGPRSLENFFKAHFRAPAQVVKGSLMPAFDLSETDLERLTFYMFSLRRSNYPESLWPKDRLRVERFGAREFASDGATLYGTFCAACHGQRGEGRHFPGMAVFPAVANPDFLALAADEFIASTIRHGRPGRRMPAWARAEGGLLEAEIPALIAYLRALGGSPATAAAGDAQRKVTGAFPRGAALYAQSCAGCHGADGQGQDGPALNNRVFLESASDSFLIESIRRGRGNTSMPSFRIGSTVRRVLADDEVEEIVNFLRSWEGKP